MINAFRTKTKISRIDVEFDYSNDSMLFAEIPRESSVIRVTTGHTFGREETLSLPQMYLSIVLEHPVDATTSIWRLWLVHEGETIDPKWHRVSNDSLHGCTLYAAPSSEDEVEECMGILSRMK